MSIMFRRAHIMHFRSKARKRAAVLAMTGAAIAAAVGLAVPAGASPLARAVAPSVSGTEHFQIMTTSASSTTASVVTWGVFTAPGVDHESTSNANTATDTFTFAGGSFKVTHTGKSQKQSFNKKTCFLQFSQKGVYKLSGGTGTYKGISGKGTFTVAGVGIEPKTASGKCNGNANPVAFQQVIAATGPVKLP